MSIVQNFSRKIAQRMNASLNEESKRMRVFVSSKSYCEKFFTFGKRMNLLIHILILSLITSYWLLATVVHADHNPANDSAGIQITITPRYDRGIEIDTGTVNLNLGLMEMGVATQTVSPATVTIVGNITNTELDMSAQITGGWIFDDNVTESTETDKLAVWAVFKTTTSTAVPTKSGSNFDDAQDSLNSGTASFGSVRVGTQEGDSGLNGRFEDGNVNMDSLMPETERHLWFYFKTPPITSTDNEQKIQFTLSVTPGS